mmetsp:Transcript_18929/g.34142  ORF Transcript_18929/g.34142 Transcript_18929/m.34142 type:complete len:201 (+) Transcript_18929:1037-1639(+)
MGKELVQAGSISLVQFLRIGMLSTDHLREIDQRHNRFGLTIVEQFHRLWRFIVSVGACITVVVWMMIGLKLLQIFWFPRTPCAQHSRIRLGSDGHSGMSDIWVVFFRQRFLLNATQIYEQVELVQIAMDQAVLSKAQRQITGLMKYGRGLFRRQVPRTHLIQRHPSNQRHGDYMAIVCDRFWSRIVDIVQGFHKGKLLER